MTVTLLAYPALTPAALDLLAPDEGTSAADHLHETAGRSCYRSFHRPNPKTAANADYLANVIAQGHTSVLGHASFTFLIDGVSRALTHELVRHRWWTFSEISQRFVSMEGATTVVPPLLRGNAEAESIIREHHAVSAEAYDRLVAEAERELVAQGVTGTMARKRAREAARAVLPGGTETTIVASANTRAIRDFVQQRWSEHADLEIREVAGEVLALMREHAPGSVQDITL